jgi:L-amino acid N-acyltransferase YncA
MAFSIVPAEDAHLEGISSIYGHHVLHGLASFETEPPGLEEMRKRHAAVVSQGFPYIVGLLDGEVVGYAYANLFRTRPAYRFMLEDSIYLRHDMGGRGYGKLLLTELIKRCEAIGIRQILAVIGDSGNLGSIKLHAACGFTPVGTIKNSGFKFGRWVDTVLMQLEVGEGATTLPRMG